MRYQLHGQWRRMAMMGMSVWALCSAVMVPIVAPAQTVNTQWTGSQQGASTMGDIGAPATLTAITVLSDKPGETQLKLSLAPQVNTHVAAPDATGTPAIAFTLTSRAPGLVVPSGFAGPVQRIVIEDNQAYMFIRFEPKSPRIHIAAKDNADHSVTVILSESTNPVFGSASDLGLDKSVRAVGNSANDSGMPYAHMGFELVMLKYADISEVAGLLTDVTNIRPNDTFTPRSPGFGSTNNNGLSGYNLSPQQQQVNEVQSLGQTINANVAVDRRLNAIWLRGDPATIETLKAQIAAIDQPIDSVMFETQIVELTQSGANSLGIDFSNSNGAIAAAAVTVGNNFSGYGSTPSAKIEGSGAVSLQAAIYAQVQNGEGRILSRPRIAAQSGASARIITGDAIPILTSITLSGVNGVSQQVQYVNVGVTLQIAPRVTNDGLVSSHIFCVVSSVTGYSQGYPTISQREAQTYATVRDGESFVIGGLTQEAALKSDSGIPFFSKLPILGALAGVNKLNSSSTELYIMVTPRIIRRIDPATMGGRDTTPPGSFQTPPPSPLQ